MHLNKINIKIKKKIIYIIVSALIYHNQVIANIYKDVPMTRKATRKYTFKNKRTFNKKKEISIHAP